MLVLSFKPPRVDWSQPDAFPYKKFSEFELEIDLKPDQLTYKKCLEFVLCLLLEAQFINLIT